ncbi:transposase [Pseudomonas sp. SMN5]|uniref:transposase n=1 Tax=Pseudomonas sp. SMN5 TaxID=3390198 RepID=UPI003F868107
MQGVPLHLIQRGNNRTACFYSDEDYLFFIELLAEQASKSRCEVHAFCLMTNHVHLLVGPQEQSSAASLMKGVGQKYVQYVNRTYGRSGTYGRALPFLPCSKQ